MFNIIYIFFKGTLANLKRNQIKLSDNILRILQERDEERKERKIQAEIISQLRDEVRILVNF